MNIYFGVYHDLHIWPGYNHNNVKLSQELTIAQDLNIHNFLVSCLITVIKMWINLTVWNERK